MAHSTGSMVEIADEEGRGGGCPAADRAPTSRTLLTVLTVFSRVARIREHRSSQCSMKCPAPSSKVMTPDLLLMPPTDDEHNDPKDRHCEGERITDAIVAHWVHFLRRPDQ